MITKKLFFAAKKILKHRNCRHVRCPNCPFGINCVNSGNPVAYISDDELRRISSLLLSNGVITEEELFLELL